MSRAIAGLVLGLVLSLLLGLVAAGASVTRSRMAAHQVGGGSCADNARATEEMLLRSASGREPLLVVSPEGHLSGPVADRLKTVADQVWTADGINQMASDARDLCAN